MDSSTSKFRALRQQVNIDIAKPISNLNVTCANCKENYCCINQKSIDVLDYEFDNIFFHVKDKHIERAKNQLNREDGLISCPFNDPETKQCDIYKDRFMVCSLHKVVSPSEDCDSILKPEHGTLIVDKIEIANRLKGESFDYLIHLSKYKKASDIIDQFKRIYKI